MTKVSVLKWSHNWPRTIRSGVFGIAKIVKITCFACIFQIFGYANNTTSDGPSAILRPLYNRYFCHITIKKWSLIYTRTIRKCLFKDILFLGAFPILIPIVNSISNLDHEGVELSCWNFSWLITAPKDPIKNISRLVWMILTNIDTPYRHASSNQWNTPTHSVQWHSRRKGRFRKETITCCIQVTLEGRREACVLVTLLEAGLLWS